MAIGLRRLVALAIALAFVAGSWSWLPPCAMAQPHSGLHAGMATGSTQPKAPPIDCIGHPGCIAAAVVQSLPPALTVTLWWTSTRYDTGAPHLAGLFVEPDLFPPILAS